MPKTISVKAVMLRVSRLKKIIEEVSKKVIEAHQWDIGHYGIYHEHTISRHCKGCIASAITQTIKFIEYERLIEVKSIFKDFGKFIEKIKSEDEEKQKTKLD